MAGGKRAVVSSAVESLNHGCRYLNLKGKGLLPEEVRVIVEGLKYNKSVLKVDLSNNERMGDQGCWYLADAIRLNTSLLELDLTNTGITGNGIRQLTKKFKVSDYQRTRVRKLNIEKNLYGSRGPTALYKTLAMGSTLRDIKLSGLNEEGMDRLAQAILANQTPLEKLHVAECEVSLVFVQHVINMASQCENLKVFRLGMNLSEQVLLRLLDGLNEGSKLVLLGIESSIVTEPVLCSLAQLLRNKPGLRCVEFIDCHVNVNQQVVDNILGDVAQHRASNGIPLALQGLPLGNHLKELLCVAEPESAAPGYQHMRRTSVGCQSAGRAPYNEHDAENVVPTRQARGKSFPASFPSSSSSSSAGTGSASRTPLLKAKAGSFDRFGKRLMNVTGRLKEKAYIAADPFKAQIAVATQAASRYNQVVLYSSETGEELSVVRLGRKVGAITFDPQNGNLVVATSSGQSQLLCYEYFQEENAWKLVWKKPLYGYGPYVQAMSAFGAGVFLKLEMLPTEVSIPSRFLVYAIESETLHTLACDGSYFPRCSEVFFFPQRSGVFLYQDSASVDTQSRLLVSKEAVTQLNGRMAIPPQTKMSIGSAAGIDQENCMIVCTPREEILVLSWCRKEPLLDNFKVTYFQAQWGQPLRDPLVTLDPYSGTYSSELYELHQVHVTELRGIPEVTQVQGASLGLDNKLYILFVERVKMPGKKWFLFKRYVFVFDGWNANPSLSTH